LGKARHKRASAFPAATAQVWLQGCLFSKSGFHDCLPTAKGPLCCIAGPLYCRNRFRKLAVSFCYRQYFCLKCYAIILQTLRPVHTLWQLCLYAANQTLKTDLPSPLQFEIRQQYEMLS
jgi:hypothetical protein